jgi:Protein of unknown function (DUF2934)
VPDASLQNSTAWRLKEEVMATKRVTPVKKTKPKATRKALASELTDSAVMAVLESTQTGADGHTAIDPDVRRQLVAAEAYFLAERRGFAAGNEVEDWVTAEAVVASRLQHKQVA